MIDWAVASLLLLLGEVDLWAAGGNFTTLHGPSSPAHAAALASSSAPRRWAAQARLELSYHSFLTTATKLLADGKSIVDPR